jgi:hypothetical protein
MRGARSIVVLASAAALSAAGSDSQPTRQPFAGVLDEHPAIAYAHRPTHDRVSMLDRAIRDGTKSLGFQTRGGYLRPVLEALGVPVESQLLVFSKTGIQREMTGPRSPRAIFFDQSVVVGYVPGARFLEVAAHDPEQGVIFYTLEQTAAGPPAFARRGAECLTCHVSAATLEVPGMIVRSNVLDADGGLMPQLGSFAVNHRTPLPNRWGGWFVTGNYTRPPYDGTAHMGNVTIAMHPESGPSTTSNEVFIEWLNGVPEKAGYPSADSDIAALLVFDHQMHAMNLLTRLNWESRVAASDGRADFDRGMLRELVDDLTDYFLFVDEAAPPGRVIPRPGFSERFTAGAPRDRHGRSLRELDLETRLLRYPCSYMVYTEAFERLPAAAKNAVYERIWAVLSGREPHPKYAHLAPADRRAIVEILRDTKKDLPASFGR